MRFGVERLLYRLSQSRHADRFLLKGAMLFALWDEKAPRPTQDVDLLAYGSTELDDIAALFREIVETPVPADGLIFQPDSIRVEQIREADAYGGVRVRLLAFYRKKRPASGVPQQDGSTNDHDESTLQLQLDPGVEDLPRICQKLCFWLVFNAPACTFFPVLTH